MALKAERFYPLNDHVGHGTVTAKNESKEAKCAQKLSSCSERWPYKPRCTPAEAGERWQPKREGKRNAVVLPQNRSSRAERSMASWCQAALPGQARAGKAPSQAFNKNPTPLPRSPHRALPRAPGLRQGWADGSRAWFDRPPHTLFPRVFHCSPTACSSPSS